MSYLLLRHILGMPGDEGKRYWKEQEGMEVVPIPACSHSYCSGVNCQVLSVWGASSLYDEEILTHGIADCEPME